MTKSTPGTVFLFACIALTGCAVDQSGGAGGDAVNDPKTAPSNPSNPSASTESSKRGTVKLSRAGASVVEYTSTGVEGNIDGGQIYFELNSPNGAKEVVHLTIHATVPGTYELAPEAATGKAHLLFFTESKLPGATAEVPGSWTPDSGTLKLETATDTRAKGTWTATGRPNGDDAVHTIEGTFDIPLHRLEE